MLFDGPNDLSSVNSETARLALEHVARDGQPRRHHSKVVEDLLAARREASDADLRKDSFKQLCKELRR